MPRKKGAKETLQGKDLGKVHTVPVSAQVMVSKSASTCLAVCLLVDLSHLIDVDNHPPRHPPRQDPLGVPGDLVCVVV
jgi:hypothetical protein